MARLVVVQHLPHKNPSFSYLHSSLSDFIGAGFCTQVHVLSISLSLSLLLYSIFVMFISTGYELELLYLVTLIHCQDNYIQIAGILIADFKWVLAKVPFFFLCQFLWANHSFWCLECWVFSG